MIAPQNGAQLESEIRDFETWRHGEKLWRITKARLTKLWKAHIIDEFPADLNPSDF